MKTDGKAVPDIRKKGGEENVFPRFETFRENVEGHFWFPTYTRSNDILRFSSGDVPIRMTVKYENYKRFGVTVKIGTPRRRRRLHRTKRSNAGDARQSRVAKQGFESVVHVLLNVAVKQR